MTRQYTRPELAAIGRAYAALGSTPTWESRPLVETVVVALSDAGLLMSPEVAEELRVLRAESERRGPEERPAASSGPTLTMRQLAILAGIAAGESCEQTARRVSITEHTVRTHRRRIYKALGVQSGGHAVMVAVAAGLLEPQVPALGVSS